MAPLAKKVPDPWGLATVTNSSVQIHEVA